MTTHGESYVTHEELAQMLRELELRIEVRMGDLENRLLREIHSSRNWLIAVVLPLYATQIAVLIFLYNAKP